QQHAREDHRTGGRRLDVRIRQPRVERKHRDLDGKTYKECEEDPPLEVERQVLADRLKRENVECAAGPELGGYLRVLCCDRWIDEVQRQKSEQHENGAD